MALPSDIAKAGRPAREEEVEENTEESGEDLIEDGVSTSEESPRTIFCTSCGKEIDNAFWCHHCGATKKVDTLPTRQKVDTPPTTQQRAKKARWAGWNNLWPKIVDRESARRAARQGIWASGFYASGQVLFLLMLAVPRTSEWASTFLSVLADASTEDVWVELVLHLSIVLAIYRFCSRIAAVSGLVLLVGGKLWGVAHLIELGLPQELATRKLFGGTTLCMMLFYVNSIRGTFAYQRFTAN